MSMYINDSKGEKVCLSLKYTGKYWQAQIQHGFKKWKRNTKNSKKK